MLDIAVHRDLEKAQRLWRRMGPPTCLFDLWPVRECFQNEYRRPPYILEARQNGRFRGMLPLSWIEETRTYGFFPGEVWQGNTWLEQNKLLADSHEVAEALLEGVPDAARIRYLSPSPYLNRIPVVDVDEVGFLFFPWQYRYAYTHYLATFSNRSRKKIRHEIERLTARGLTFRYDHLTPRPLYEIRCLPAEFPWRQPAPATRTACALG